MVDAYTGHLKSHGDHKNQYIPLHSFYNVCFDVMKFYAGLTNRVKGCYIANISQIVNETD